MFDYVWKYIHIIIIYILIVNNNIQMDIISALEAYKVSIVLEEFCKKLSFLDLLKQNMGEEMSE